MARTVDALCNELGITVPVALHADHYGIRNDKDLAQAKVEIPTLFETGLTSIAIDASHLPDDKNLLANVALNPFVPGGPDTKPRWVRSKVKKDFPRWKKLSSSSVV